MREVHHLARVARTEARALQEPAGRGQLRRRPDGAVSCQRGHPWAARSTADDSTADGSVAAPPPTAEGRPARGSGGRGPCPPPVRHRHGHPRSPTRIASGRAGHQGWVTRPRGVHDARPARQAARPPVGERREPVRLRRPCATAGGPPTIRRCAADRRAGRRDSGASGPQCRVPARRPAAYRAHRPR